MLPYDVSIAQGEKIMQRMLFVIALASVLALGAVPKTYGWGAYHVGYTHVGYGGIQHYGRTFAYGRGGVYGGARYGGYGYGGLYRGGYGYGGLYGGLYGYGGYAPVYGGGYAVGGYHYGGVYGDAYRAGVYRRY
jgi:hypothetical protein